jgi:4-hydroxybenzoate polyprenyltransferase
LNGLTRLLFFGNYFYGFCTIALSIEANLQQHIPLNSFTYYLFVFAATVLYYTHAYISEPVTDPLHHNKRAAWYAKNRVLIGWSQLALTIVCLTTGSYLLRENWKNLLHLEGWRWLLVLIFPVVAALYYGSVSPGSSTRNLRRNGWLKPFVIGFVWAGAVTVYPVIFSDMEHNRLDPPNLFMFLLTLKNLMYITMLCIMFDIKDYAADHNSQLKTFVVRYGLRFTIFSLLIPLSLAGLAVFLVFTTIRGFPLPTILINMIPFLLLITVAYSMHRRKSILYYLAIIDGLMLVKAICGIAGMIFIK